MIMAEDKEVRMLFWVDKETKKQFKIKCALDGVSMKHTLEGLMKECVAVCERDASK